MAETRAHDFTRELAGECNAAADGALVGVYLHGSAVLGDWDARASDVDVLVVVDDDVAPTVVDRLASILAGDGECPGVGLEASVVVARAAALPAEPWPFVLHVTTAPADRKVVWGQPGHGDVDLVLHYAVVRDHGWAAFGPNARSVIGPVADHVVLEQLVGELRWAVEHAGAPYATLNACRALRFHDERVLCSKTSGGEWALAHGIRPDLVSAALEARQQGAQLPLTAATTEWVTEVAAALSG